MNRDNRQQPGNTGPRHGTFEAELQEKFAQLTRRPSKLSADEAALSRTMLPVIRAAHHKHVWDRLRRRRLPRHDAEELYQDAESGVDTPEWQHRLTRARAAAARQRRGSGSGSGSGSVRTRKRQRTDADADSATGFRNGRAAYPRPPRG